MNPEKNIKSYRKNNEDVFYVDKKNFSLSSIDINIVKHLSKYFFQDHYLQFLNMVC